MDLLDWTAIGRFLEEHLQIDHFAAARLSWNALKTYGTLGKDGVLRITKEQTLIFFNECDHKETSTYDGSANYAWEVHGNEVKPVHLKGKYFHVYCARCGWLIKNPTGK